MKKIGILNLEINNIKSIYRASKLISETYILNHSDDYQINTGTLILPGNGKFSHGMKSIMQKKFTKLITEHLSNGNKLIGICLGMQLLMNKSVESNDVDGLGLIEGIVKIIPEKKYKIPLIGWYNVSFKNMFFEDGSFFFNNKYFVTPVDKLLSIGILNNDLPVFIKKNNIYGLQFHPEKSTQKGIDLLKKIISLK
jgi:imidazole glycerol-phosphate synthase subunit HisH